MPFCIFEVLHRSFEFLLKSDTAFFLLPIGVHSFSEKELTFSLAFEVGHFHAAIPRHMLGVGLPYF